MSDIQIDPEMDMTEDLDLLKGSRGIKYFMTDLDDLPKDLFKKYVQGKNFLDIGCGDGRVISLAMQCGAKKYRGVEIDEKFINGARMQRFIHKCDFKDIKFDSFDVLYYFLSSDEKSEAELLEISDAMVKELISITLVFIGFLDFYNFFYHIILFPFC